MTSDPRASRQIDAVAAGVGLALWLLLVPNDGPGGEARVPAFWWIMLGAAIALGMGSRARPSVIGFSLVAPQLLMAPWSAPRGDGDGLWILWFPMLGLFGLVLAASAWAGTRLRAIIEG